MIRGRNLTAITFLRFLLVLCGFTLFQLPMSCSAYHVGDTVATDIIVDMSVTDARRDQMPKFGVSSSTMFSDVAQHSRFSMSFEDGLWGIPAVDLHSGSKHLKQLTVSFVYSKSGALHAVSSQASYSETANGDQFVVWYEWKEEPAMQVATGQAVLYLCVLIVGIYYVIASCNLSAASEEEDQRGFGGSSASGGVPKWD